jgi:hypothetical protein
MTSKKTWTVAGTIVMKLLFVATSPISADTTVLAFDLL